MVSSHLGKLAAAILIVAALFFALGWWNKKQEQWSAYPQQTIVDSPEEFQRRNTP